jgi:hypothetical protein
MRGDAADDGDRSVLLKRSTADKQNVSSRQKGSGRK